MWNIFTKSCVAIVAFELFILLALWSIPEEVADSSFTAYTDDIKIGKHIARCFVANNRLWTATHIMDWRFEPGQAPSDITCFAVTDDKGYAISTAELPYDAELFFVRKPDILIKMWKQTEFDENTWNVLCAEPIIFGDSGSPVFDAQGNCVGLVSYTVDIGGEPSKLGGVDVFTEDMITW